jgi:hypothetical protein
MSRQFSKCERECAERADAERTDDDNDRPWFRDFG